MWSPKRTKNGSRNAFYKNMRERAPGDIVIPGGRVAPRGR
jgi:hypothetical protein